MIVCYKCGSCKKLNIKHVKRIISIIGSENFYKKMVNLSIEQVLK